MHEALHKPNAIVPIELKALQPPVDFERSFRVCRLSGHLNLKISALCTNGHFDGPHRSIRQAVEGPLWAVHVAQHDPRRQSSLSSAEGGCEPLVPCRKSHENLIINDL
jgi:hypothetical protein